MAKRILVVAAHADDEVLGCGGAMARHADVGDEVHVIFVADGVTSRGITGKSHRHEPAFEACRILGAKEPVFLDLPDQKLDTIGFLAVTQMIEQETAKVDADIIYTHHGGDLNLDHRIVHQAVMTAFRPMPASRWQAIYAFEVASSTEWSHASIGYEFRPDHFVNIESTVERKIAALKAYDEEMRPFPHARSYEALSALATLRGAHVGLKAAEGFVTLRSIVR